MQGPHPPQIRPHPPRNPHRKQSTLFKCALTYPIRNSPFNTHRSKQPSARRKGTRCFLHRERAGCRRTMIVVALLRVPELEIDLRLRHRVSRSTSVGHCTWGLLHFSKHSGYRGSYLDLCNVNGKVPRDVRMCMRFWRMIVHR